jgi:protein-S-isoprenylcysteine O-methyltransferase Ste14
MNLTKLWDQIFIPGADPFFTIVNLLIGLSLLTLITAILIDFVEARTADDVWIEKKSVVATGSMSVFTILFSLLLRFRLGAIGGVPDAIHKSLAVIGLAVIMLGCLVNIRGRVDLGKNWGNQIRIYRNHTLVTTGVYRWVRHPLYTSIIWMFYGTCLVYLNLAALMAVTIVFLPFMVHRARQEERLLLEKFPEYRDYRKLTGMFIPKPAGRMGK